MDHLTRSETIADQTKIGPVVWLFSFSKAPCRGPRSAHLERNASAAQSVMSQALAVAWDFCASHGFRDILLSARTNRTRKFSLRSLTTALHCLNLRNRRATSVRRGC